jgi:hypothetical protein
MSGVCQYHIDILPKEVVRNGFVLHRGLCINETLARVNSYFLKAGSSPEFSPDVLDHAIEQVPTVMQSVTRA